MAIDVSIITINYNTKKLCEQTIHAVIATTQEVDYEIIVVDNSSLENEFYTESSNKIKVFRVENKGFSHACNVGAKEAEGEIFLFLNSDTMVHLGAIDKAIKFIRSSKQYSMLGIRTVLLDGRLDTGCKRSFPTPSNSVFYFLQLDKIFPKNKLLGSYRMTYVNDDQTTEVDAISGSFLMIYKKLFYSIGGFDESFFMGGEDLDLCYRVKQAGNKIVYYAGASMTHLRGQSSKGKEKPKVTFYFHESMKLFYDKHYKDKYNFFITKLVYFAIEVRYRLCLLKNGSYNQREKLTKKAI